MSIEELTAEEQAILRQDESAPAPEPEEQAEVTEEPVALEEPEASEPEAEEAAEAAPEAAQPAPADPSKPPEGFVPHQAMHAEREKRKELERRLAELEKANAPAPEAPPQYVDPIIDPDGYRKWAEFNNSQHSTAIEQFQKQQAEQQKRVERQMKATAQEQQFMATNPDYQEAAGWLIDQRVNEMRGQGMLDEQISKQIEQQINATYDAAEMIGMSFPQMVWNMAQGMGWQKTAAAPKVDETQRVEALAQAQAATQGITSTGAPQKGKLTLKQLAEMSEEELDKIPASQKRALLG